MELRDYLKVVRRRWRVILVSLVVVVALASLVTLRTTPQYESKARLFVSSTERSTSDAYQGGLFSIQRVSSYADLVKGQELSSRVIDRLGLQMTPADLSKKITATVVPDTVILEVSATDPNPREAQKIGQAVAIELTQFVSELETPPGKANAPLKATVVDSANLPTSPVSPQPLRNLGLAVVLGLLLGVGLAVVRELLDTSIKGPQDIAAITETPVLGGILFDSNAPKQPLITDLSPHSPRVESFRILRTNLQFVDVDRRMKVFVVTSSVPGEGKTSTASNIALALQTAGQRTLLVDGDMRRPQLAKLFSLEGSVGLTSILLGRISLEEAVQEHRRSGLAVLTSGSLPPNPAELLQSHAMKQLLDEARMTYDTIVIDAPPLLPVTDAALIAAQVDGAIVVVRQGKTTRDQLSHSIERLTAVGARPLGVTLNMVARRGRKGYGYG
ncbi:MAG TPA: polysaccharide biosynthesis tyrosine autokinase, partial [Nocardioidaceae bacterium]|nr:polysaccharide biosynthesis tyrosine autokinase [Nocardioidaceae bacterium]